jgi:predicted dehydrogenase
MKSLSISRRDFLKSSILGIGALTVAFPHVSRGRVLGANARIQIACIGVDGKGDSDSTDAAECGGNIVALCDVDKGALDAKAEQFGEKFPRLGLFRDYRKMLDQIARDIDAVTISIPDHHHGGAAIRAMKMGKHCFCQKPLCQTVHEARVVRQLAEEKNLATQMGNQGSASEGLRRAVEIIQAGVTGKQPLCVPPFASPGASHQFWNCSCCAFLLWSI